MLVDPAISPEKIILTATLYTFKTWRPRAMNPTETLPVTTPQADVRTFSANSSAPKYGSINTFGNAEVQLGDRYGANQDLFESGTEEERRDSLLNLLYYDGFDLKRDQLALSNVCPRSFSWVDKETDLTGWLQSKTAKMPFFWINGKPGSGKSTLVKHLAESRSVLTKLCARGEKWTVVHFFFDYRAGSVTANKPLGMLKLFLRQLSIIKEVKEKLCEVPAYYLASENIDKILDVLATVLRDLQLRICAFVDGLDEYEGDLWNLCILLENLQHRTGMKMCLVSRPEAAFEQTFAAYPSIVMQEHNSTSIRLYARQKFNKFLAQYPLVDQDLFPDELLDAISEKAQGIILWARLVIDEIVKSCQESTVLRELFTMLRSLSPELEALYDRILNRTNRTYRKETATMLHLLVENDSSMKAMTLFQAWDYIKEVILEETANKNFVEFQIAEARLKALLGNLVDFVRIKKKPVMVRLLHRSFSSYLTRTKWVTINLPDKLTQLFPDHFSKRLAIHCMEHADQCNAVTESQLDGLFPNMTGYERPTNLSQAVMQSTNLQRSFVGRLPKRSASSTIQDCLPVSKPWSRWTDLFLHVIQGFFSFTTDLDHGRQSSGNDLRWPRISSTAAWWHWYIILSVWKSNGMELLINIVHGQDDWVLEQLIRRYPCGSCCKASVNYTKVVELRFPTPLAHHGQSSCRSSPRLFDDLLTFVCHRDIKNPPIPLGSHLHSYLLDHSDNSTPVCVLYWDKLLYASPPATHDHLLNLCKLRKCFTLAHAIDSICSDTFIVSRKHLNHLPFCPLAKTSTHASYHGLIPFLSNHKNNARMVLQPTYNPKTGSIIQNLLSAEGLCSDFQSIRDKLNLLVANGVLLDVNRDMELEIRARVRKTITPSDYPECMECLDVVDEADILQLLRDIIGTLGVFRTLANPLGNDNLD